MLHRRVGSCTLTDAGTDTMHYDSSERFRRVRKLSQTPQNSVYCVHTSEAKNKEMPRRLVRLWKRCLLSFWPLRTYFCWPGLFFITWVQLQIMMKMKSWDYDVGSLILKAWRRWWTCPWGQSSPWSPPPSPDPNHPGGRSEAVSTAHFCKTENRIFTITTIFHNFHNTDNFSDLI